MVSCSTREVLIQQVTMPLSVMLASKGAVWEKGRVPLNSMQAWVRDAAVRARSIGEDFMIETYEASIFCEVMGSFCKHRREM